MAKRWKVIGYCGADVEEVNQRTHERRNRAMTDAEKAAVAKYEQAEEERINEMHFLYWQFCEKVLKCKRLTKKEKQRCWRFALQHTLLTIKPRCRLSGYPAMKAAEKFAAKHPSVKLVRCDDGGHSSSLIVFIPHETKDHYWGTTVVCVPQNAGPEPLEMFCYPGHLDDLFAALRELQRHERTVNKRQKKPMWPF